MRATGLVAATCLLASSAATDLPVACSAYSECGDLLGDCCPNSDGVMLDCCILGAVRMHAEALLDTAKEKSETAAEASAEVASAAAKAAELAKAAKAKRAEVEEANEASEEALKSADEARAKYAETAKLVQESKCENNPGCDAAGLTGFCCPTLSGQTLNGTMLECCPPASGARIAARLTATARRRRRSRSRRRRRPVPDEPVPLDAVSLASAAEESPTACSAYDECGALQGDCCPNRDGVMLSCCILGAVRMKAEALEAAAEKLEAQYEKVHSASEKAEAEYAKTEKLIAGSKCENNPACVGLGLTGYCCPTLVGMTLNGTMLGCCGGGGGALAQRTSLSEEPPPLEDGLVMPLAAAVVASAAAGVALVMGVSRCRRDFPADGYVAAAA